MGTATFWENRTQEQTSRYQLAAKLLSGMVALVLAVGLLPMPAFADYGPEDENNKPKVGGVFRHQKLTGTENDGVLYTVTKDSGSGVQGTVKLGGVSEEGLPVQAIPSQIPGTVLIPKNVCYVYAWEKSCVYEVTAIAANAFAYTEDALPAFDTILIEADVVLEEGALDNIPETIKFKTYSKVTADALVKAGIPASRLTYEPLNARYVAFGDSISAGYALTKEYNASSSDTCDNLPTPLGAFTNLVGQALDEKYGSTIVDNQSMSGWTSEQLLAQLNRGDYNATLKTADMVSVTIGSNDLLGRFMDIIGEAVQKTLEDIKKQSGLTDEQLELIMNTPAPSSATSTLETNEQPSDAALAGEAAELPDGVASEEQSPLVKESTIPSDASESSYDAPGAPGALSGQPEVSEPSQQSNAAPLLQNDGLSDSASADDRQEAEESLDSLASEVASSDELKKEGQSDESVEQLRKKVPHIFPILVKNINAAVENDAQLLAACEKFKTTTQPAILSKLHELAPQAAVYWTTLYNPFYDTKIDVGELFPIIQALNPSELLVVDLGGPGDRYIREMNKAFEVNTAGYYAVDLFTPFNNHGLTNVDIRKDEVDGKIYFDIDPHPNAAGHQLFATVLNERIASTFRLAPAPEVNPPSNIVPEVPVKTGKQTALAATGDSLFLGVVPVVVGAIALLVLSVAYARRKV